MRQPGIDEHRFGFVGHSLVGLIAGIECGLMPLEMKHNGVVNFSTTASLPHRFSQGCNFGLC
jgi:hypothetical protein